MPAEPTDAIPAPTVQPVQVENGKTVVLVSQPVVVPPEHDVETPTHPGLKIYSHSTLLYWWPVWAVGFLMSFLSYAGGQQHQIGDGWAWFHPSSNPGVLFFSTLFLVILITNISVRGLASAIVILVVVLAMLFFAYMSWWDDILDWVGELRVYLNLGAYLAFSTLVFIVWAFTVFVFDRFTYWRIKPGQVTQEYLFGAGSRSYDTDNMVLEKFRDDVFRHWVLGLGTGDLHIRPYGARQEEIQVPNVLFVGAKVRAIQRMIATEPDKFGHAVLK